MKIEFIVNGGVTGILMPENTLDEEILRTLLKQSNTFTEIRSSINVLSKTVKGCVLICSKGSIESEMVNPTIPEP